MVGSRHGVWAGLEKSGPAWLNGVRWPPPSSPQGSPSGSRRPNHCCPDVSVLHDPVPCEVSRRPGIATVPAFVVKVRLAGRTLLMLGVGGEAVTEAKFVDETLRELWLRLRNQTPGLGETTLPNTRERIPPSCGTLVFTTHYLAIPIWNASVGRGRDWRRFDDEN